MTDILVPDILISNPAAFGGRPVGKMRRGTPVIRDSRLCGLDAPQGGAARIVLPPLVEAHCHLDKCHTLHRLGPVGGDLSTAIAMQRADKSNWSDEDLRTRMSKGVAEAQASGCHHIRSHVDWGDAVTAPLAWEVIGELAQDHPGLQRAALTGVMQWTDTDFANAVALRLAADQGVLGAFVYGQPDHERGLRALFAQALEQGLPLDFHVDEGLGAMNGLEVIADTAIATGYTGPILCGHAVSLMDRAHDDFARIVDKLLATNIHICALPTTNLYLQGRADGTPDRRGLTRLRELQAAGVPIVVASDNVADAFCPTGAHDPMAALNLAVLAAHLDPPLDRWLPAITTHAATAIGRDATCVDTSPVAQLLTYDTPNLADIVAGRVRPAPLAKAPA